MPDRPPGPAGPSERVAAAVADAHRREWAFVLAATARVTRDLDAAEECVQDAYVRALDAWTRDGVPRHPGAWLTTAARRLALNRLRRERTLRAKLPLLVEPDASGTDAGAGVEGERAATGAEGDDVVRDDRLRLVFTCCHPALALDAQVALTLRLVCGVSTADIAHAFLVREPTMAARVTRAKKKIAEARIPYRVPAAAELPDRLAAVLTVVHLVCTTGHSAPTGDRLVRDDLLQRSVDLARMLHELMPDEPEVRGLLALVLATAARRPGRTAADGSFVPLADQDRSGWDRDLIEEAHRLVLGALRTAKAGRFALQAAIAVLHARAPSYAETDWPQVVRLYGALLAVWPSPVVALNRAIALAMVDAPADWSADGSAAGPATGPAAGLAELDRLAAGGRLTGYRYLPAARADLLRRLSRTAEAAAAYREALALTDNAAERAYLEGRLAELS